MSLEISFQSSFLRECFFKSIFKIKDAIYTIISSLHTIFYMVSLNEFKEYF